MVKLRLGLSIIGVLIGASHVVLAAPGQAGIVNWAKEASLPPPPPGVERAPDPTQNTNSVFTIGTMFGLTFPLHTPDVYKVRNDNVVVTEHTARAGDWVLPGVYILPSIGVWGRNGMTLSVVVPAGLNANKDYAIGFGPAFTWAVKSKAAIGAALCVIWTSAQDLNDAQRTSLNTGAPLPPGEATTIGTSLQPSLGLGIFVAPLF